MFDLGATARVEVRERLRRELLRLIEAYSGSVNPEVEAAAGGKPHAPGLPWLHFNMSHSGRWGAIVFALDQPVGIDIELKDRRLEVDGVSRRFFSPAEAAAVARREEDDRRHAFLALWTRKEAVLKAVGSGLADGLHRVEFALPDAGFDAPLIRFDGGPGNAADWQLRPLEGYPHLVGTVAWQGPPRSVRWHGADR